ncbi:MAG: hypothetical protein KZQ97_16775 [Candidatus Thiodiazotropha sp. (ex Dulcina madagascariensis)]|nr:hypothetical protein [Candidatus Thiodiazotropha sp. (ex Dulcina madagascariensis)]
MERSTAVFRFKAHEIFDAMAQHLGMRYTYKETVTKPVSAPVEVGTEAVASLPKERRESLYDAAVSLSNEQFDAALLSVRERDPALAEGLAALTGEFRFDRILELLDDTGRKEA